MLRVDASSAKCLVFTYKEGLLSAVAHDLKLAVTKFVIEGDPEAGQLEARFDATSLRVVCAMQDGVDVAGALSAANKKEIEANIVRDVLEANTYPEIRFTASTIRGNAAAQMVKGSLSLHGHTRQVTIAVRREGDEFVGEVRVNQPDFGIRPYSALFGTLKVQSAVKVHIRVPIAATVPS